MADRQLRKVLRAQLLKTSPGLLPSEVVELRDILESRLELAKGDKGEQGPIGPRGPQGESIQGPRGPQGEPGEDGYTPVKGKDYVDGKPGLDGKDGAPGKDANFDSSPLYQKLQELAQAQVTVEQIIEAIKNLTGDDRIDARSIKNLPSQALPQPSFGRNKKKLDFSDLRWHGGGGDLSVSGIYTQTPVGAIDGSNTTYTVTHTIHHVLGFAINGQYIMPSEYTTSGVTITFTTPLDSSLAGLPFSITYV